MSTAIEFDNVGKMYRLGRVGTGTLSHDLNRWWQTTVLRREDPYLRIGETNDRTTRGESDYVWALRDISFKVEQGEVLGIIGKNGAGKSTLLKLLSNITSPTTGSIRYKGRIASLLEVGTGFHPEMTGRENIYMNGCIMGMTKAEITRKLDEIVDFAGVERYLDTPVKRYSSGMTVRLGFAVAAFLEPEILVVDEVLTVGDAEFQKKAIGKMDSVAKEGGRTVLFVSHNMAAVKNLCTRGLVLDKGCAVFDGKTNDSIEFYQRMSNIAIGKKIIDSISMSSSFMKINSISFNGTEFSETTIKSNQPYVDLEIKGRTTEPVITDVFICFNSIMGTPLASFAEGHYKGNLIHLSVGEFVIKKRIELPQYLSTGDYLLDIHLHQPNICYNMHCLSCVMLHVDGSFDGMGKAPEQSWGGFCGLNSI